MEDSEEQGEEMELNRVIESEELERELKRLKKRRRQALTQS